MSYIGYMDIFFFEIDENIIYYLMSFIWVYCKFEKYIFIYFDFNVWIVYVYEVKRIICFMIYSGIFYV